MQDTDPLQPVEPMIGKLLVASTTLEDPVLSRSVCLVVHQDTENVFAVLLNRPMSPPKGFLKLLDGSTGAPASAPARALPIERDPNPSPPGPPTLAEQTVTEASKSLGAIHFGGPLSGPVVAVHGSSDHAEAEAGKGVYVAARKELLETLVKQKPGPFRLIVGHLGWTADQLDAEREAGYWHVIDATEENVFAGDQDIWPKTIRRATTSSLSRWLGIKDTPFAAEVN